MKERTGVYGLPKVPVCGQKQEGPAVRDGQVRLNIAGQSFRTALGVGV